MSDNRKIQVIVIDDSVLVRKYVSQILNGIDNVNVMSTAADGKIGLQKIFLFKPDVVILDIEMPEMNGIELLKYLKNNIEEKARPYVIMFSSLIEEGSSATFEALANGAADFIKKPEGHIQANLEFLKKEFEIKIRGLYEAKKNKEVSKPKAEIEKEVQPPVENGELYGLESLEKIREKKNIKPEIVAIGSSTGGPLALRRIFESLGNIPVPVVIAQHMPAGFTGEFAKNLSTIYNRKVVETSDGSVLSKRTVHICPGGCHARIVRINGEFVFKEDYNEYDGFFFKPSVDIFFHSVLEVSGKNVLAVVLSGMGKDGSIETVKLRQAGAIVIAQDKESSVVWGMPGNSVKNGGVDIVLELDDIGPAINKIAG